MKSVTSFEKEVSLHFVQELHTYKIIKVISKQV